MTAPRARLALAIGALALLGACAAPAPPRSAPQSRAIELNGQGLARYQSGDYARAQALFEQALTLEQGMENEDGIALNLLNLAQCLQIQGQPEQAERRLDALLDSQGLHFSAARRAEAGLQKALLALRRRDLPGAARWQTEAQRACAGDCAAAGKLGNLGARLALERGEAAAALAAAGAALARNRADGDALETANALRLMASAQLMLGDRAQAAVALAEALALDKRAGHSDKIYQDLLLLGRAASDPGEQRMYWIRAQNVARAGGTPQALKEVNELLATLPAAVSN